MAICNADYEFIYVDIGAEGTVGDATWFKDSRLKAALEARALNIPPEEPLPFDDVPIPYFFAGDSAFPLRDYMIIPYTGARGLRSLGRPKRIFNYRQSRARRVIECTFGILATR